MIDMKKLTIAQRVALRRVRAKKKLGRLKDNQELAKRLQKQLQDA